MVFGGYVFKDVGAYEKIVGKAFGELDPKDPKNAVIVDIQLAPKNANGKIDRPKLKELFLKAETLSRTEVCRSSEHAPSVAQLR